MIYIDKNLRFNFSNWIRLSEIHCIIQTHDQTFNLFHPNTTNYLFSAFYDNIFYLF
jgi:hypothetical protein